MAYNKIAGMAQVTLGDSVTGDNPWVLLTMDNEVVFLGDFALTGTFKHDATLLTLPEGYRPKSAMYIPCVFKVNTTSLSLYTSTLEINSDGTIKPSVAIKSAGDTLMLRNKTFNISDAFYNSEIGNLTESGTSPW